MKQACEEEFATCDVLLMAAAVADFRPAAPDGREDQEGRPRASQLELEPTPDVLAGSPRGRRDDQTLIGFAAEHGERAIECGREKLVAKGVDAVVVNDISRTDIGFDADANEVTILTAGGERQRRSAGSPNCTFQRASKAEIAEAILDTVERLRVRLKCPDDGERVRPLPARLRAA